MGSDGVDRCNPVNRGGNGGGGGSVLSNAAQSEPSQPGEGGDGGTGVSDDGDKGGIEILDETGVGGDGGDGNPVGTGGAGGSDAGLGAGFTRVDGDPIFEPGADGLPCNSPPVLQQGTATTPKNTPVNVTLVYTDGEGDLPAPGTATVNDITPALSGTVTNFQAVGGTGLRFTFTPTPGFVGTVTFQISVNDVRGALSNVAGVQVTVTDVVGAIRNMRLEYTGQIVSGTTYTRAVTDIATLLSVGTMQYGPTGPGGFFFSSVDPPGIRHGMNGNAANAIIYYFSTLNITGDQSADVEEARFCFGNTANVSVTNPISVTFFGAAASPGVGDAGAPAQAVPPPVMITGNGCTEYINVVDAQRAEVKLGVVGVGTAVLDIFRIDLRVRTTINPTLPG